MPVFPDTYFLSLLFFVCVSAFGLPQLNTWGGPYLAVVITVGAWYLIEPIYSADSFRLNDPAYIEAVFGCVALFFMTFAIVTPALVRKFAPTRSSMRLSEAYISPERVLMIATAMWLVLLAYGVVRMQGDLLGALFPLGARSTGNMWSRSGAADAGADGFVVASAGYIYSLILALFGVFLVLIRRGGYRILAIVLILVSWPFAVLQGSRNVTLAVVMPGILCYLLYSKSSSPVKLLTGGVIFLVLEFAMRFIIQYRNQGFENIAVSEVENAHHLGLNMASELVYCLAFVDKGLIHLTYGGGYLQELANMIPRAIWPDKPLLGIDYAILRGFGGAAGNDTGVFATISTGLIGQGVLNFGPFFGPIAAAILMGFWVAFLSRLRNQGTPLRRSLFLLGLGLTFNLGRDMTLLVLWPMVFGYFGVRVLEWHQRRSVGAEQQPARAALRDPLLVGASGKSSASLGAAYSESSRIKCKSPK
jgi:oligosaccharide repeat unit polymerase